VNVRENAVRSVYSPSIERKDLAFKSHGQFTFSVKKHYITVIQRLGTLKDTGRLKTPRDSIGDCDGAETGTNTLPDNVLVIIFR
jgi:hypothetical protein